MYFAQRSILYPGASHTYRDAFDVAPWGERIEIKTTDGKTLTGLLSSAAGQKATFLFFHGNADLIGSYGFLAGALSKQGYGLLAVAFRGYPGSTGYPSEDGLLEDGRAAYRWLAAHKPNLPIIILGRSLGTGVAVNTAAEHDVAALVLVSPYDSILAVASHRYPYLPIAPLITDSYRSDLRIGKVAAPKLFLHGDADGLIPLSSGEALFTAAGEPKEFIIQPGRAHNNIWTAELIDQMLAFADSRLIRTEAE